MSTKFAGVHHYYVRAYFCKQQQHFLNESDIVGDNSHYTIEVKALISGQGWFCVTIENLL